MGIGRKRVYVIYTGGTIGMRRQNGAYAPATGLLVEQMNAMPELHSGLLPEFHVHEYEPLLDSSNMEPTDWLNIAGDISAHHEAFDGFVVLHGTDTMAFTASALAFLLPNLRKPVVLTGSQIPLCEVRNDARENIITSLLVAGSFAIPEVCLCFGERLLRGCRATKISAEGLNAFDSPNFPALGRVGIEIDIRRELLRESTSRDACELAAPALGRVAALRFFPGITHHLIRNVLESPVQGLVIEAYGAGNGPDRDVLILDALREATDRGVVIVACTQCAQGTVDLGAYETGSALAHVGVTSGLDMTTEAALTKLGTLIGQGLTPGRVREQMARSLVGELTAHTVSA